MNAPVIHSHISQKLPPHFFNGASGLQGFGNLGVTFGEPRPDKISYAKDGFPVDFSKQNEDINKSLDSLTNSPWFQLWRIASIASTAACAYHGYKRNDSVGWAIGWGLLGGMFPVITPAIAVAQGYGKKKGEN